MKQQLINELKDLCNDLLNILSNQSYQCSINENILQGLKNRFDILNIRAKQEEEYHVISSLHINDLKEIDNNVKITDNDLDDIASELGDDYTSHLFWDSLTIIYKNNYGKK